MIQRFGIGDLVHNIKTDEVGRIKEVHLDTAAPTRYKVSVAKDPANPGADAGASDAIWEESDLIASTHKAAS